MLDWIITGYVTVAIICLLVGLGLVYSYSYPEGEGDPERKTGARLALASPVWPLIILWLLWMGVSYLWAVATDDD